MRVLMIILLVCLISACGNDGDSSDPADLPTLVQTRTSTAQPIATMTSTETPAPTATFTPAESPTPTLSLTPTETPIPTETPLPTATFTPSVTPTFYFSATNEGGLPVFATLTPIPNSTPNIQSTPIIAADIVITDQQFQRALTQRLADAPGIESAAIRFTPGPDQGINVRLSALGGEAMVTGDVFFAFRMTGGFVSISVTRIDVAGDQVPERYITTIAEQLAPAITEAFDDFITNALGETHDLETLRFSNNAMEIKLLVPQP